jgi:maltooligosyltrehalose trehalohydrolase
VELPTGARYAFSLDGGPARPDPRSAYQPDGIDGASATVDHSSYVWQDTAWRGLPIEGAVIYELHPGTFSELGTFDGAVDHLDHLVDLGVDVVEVMPVAEFSGRRGWGYDGVDLFAPHHAYGGPEALKRFVEACHTRGLAVALDVVYNHLGPAGNYLREFGPYFNDRHRTPWGDAVNLDGDGSDEVRRFIIGNALMWLREYHVDGLRLDAVQEIFDSSAVHILEELAIEVRALEATLGRTLFLIAESDLNDPRVVTARAAGGYGLEAQWSDDFHHALHTSLTGERTGYYIDYDGLRDLGRAFSRGFVLDGRYSRYRRRRHGRSPRNLAGHRLVVYSQNHDQVGNRARGERLCHLVSPGLQRVAAALVLTSPFTPLLFQGEEWSASTPFQYFTDHADDGLAEAVRNGRRREFAAFGWEPETIPDPQAAATFENSRLRWDEVAGAEHATMLDWYRRLIALRRTERDLMDDRLDRVTVDFDEPGRWIRIRRGGLTVIANVSPRRAEVPLARDSAAVLLASDEVVVSEGSAYLAPQSVTILR